MQQLNRLIVGVVLLLTLNSCEQMIPTEAAVVRYLNDGAPRANGSIPQLVDVNVHRALPWSNGTTMFYTVRDVSSNPSDQIGYMVLERTLFNWRPKETGMLVRPANSITSEQSIEYVIGGSQQRNASYAIIAGRVLDPQVAVVEATFDNNQVVRDNPVDHVFAILANGANAICKVRLLKADGSQLQHITSDPNIQCQM